MILAWSDVVWYKMEIEMTNINYGVIVTIANKYNDALKVYLKANSLFPDNTDIQKKIATMFTLLGNEKKAEEWLYKMAGISDLP